MLLAQYKEVVEFSITHPDGEVIKALKKSADDADFELVDIPPGREIGSSWSVNELAGGLSALRLEEVTSDIGLDLSSPVVFTLLTADGMRVNAWLIIHQGGPWIRLGVSVYQAMRVEVEPGNEDEEALANALTERVNQINKRVSGWAYRIPQNQFDTMTNKLEDLLKPVEET